MHRRVSEVMTAAADVAAVGKQTPFKEIVRLLEERHVSGVPVVDDDGIVVGVVSEADLLARERYPHGSAETTLVEGLRHRAELHKAGALTAAEMMSCPAITIRAVATVREAARALAKAGVKRLVVVDEAGRLAGVVSRADLLKVFLRPDQEIYRELVEEVAPAGEWAPPHALHVEVADGVVTLRGQVERHSQIAMLAHLAEAVDGVVRVECHLGYRVDDRAVPVPLPGVWLRQT
jgi:CBS domain-containing protein